MKKLSDVLGTQLFTYRTTYSQHNINILFETNSKYHFEWAEHYFFPYYEKNISNFPGVQFHVRATVDSDDYRRAVTLLHNDDAKKIESHHYKFGQQYTISDSTYIILYPEEGFLIGYSLEEKSFWLITDGVSEDVRFESARIIREIFTREYENKGLFLVHAAAVERDGQGYLFCGNKGAGKTTTLLGLLKYGYNFITNDRVFVGQQSDKHAYLEGWPGAVAITLQTMLQFDPLRKILPNVREMRFPQRRLDASIDISKVNERNNLNTKDKVDLTPIEAAELFRVKVVRRERLDKIIILGHSETTTIVQLSEEEAASAIRDQILFPEDPSYPDWFNIRNGNREIEKIFMHLFEYTIKNVPVYYIGTNKKEVSIDERLKMIDTFLQSHRSNKSNVKV